MYEYRNKLLRGDELRRSECISNSEDKESKAEDQEMVDEESEPSVHSPIREKSHQDYSSILIHSTIGKDWNKSKSKKRPMQVGARRNYK